MCVCGGKRCVSWADGQGDHGQAQGAAPEGLVARQGCGHAALSIR